MVLNKNGVYLYFIWIMLLTLVMGCSNGTVNEETTTVTAENKTVAAQALTVAKPDTQVESPTDKPADQQKIAFWSLRDSFWSWDWQANLNTISNYNYEIYIMDPDGKNQVNLTNNTSADLIPRLSPDGKKIIFVSDRKWDPDEKWDKNYNIFIMDTDGSNVNNLTGHKYNDTMPCWSPDGKMVIFCVITQLDREIWVMDSEGHNFIKLLGSSNRDVKLLPSWPVWSPDGSRITFTSSKEFSYDLYVMEIDYPLLKQIVLNPQPENITIEKWSNTGDRRIVDLGNSTASLIKETRKLTLHPMGFDGAAAWSPDGKKLAYVSGTKVNGRQIYNVNVMDADGGNSVNLTKATGDDGKGAYNDWPTWSPDGKKIAFVSDREGQPISLEPYKLHWQIYMMDADGGNITRITNNSYSDGSPNWGVVPSEFAEKLKEAPLPAVTFSTPEMTIAAKDQETIKNARGKTVVIEGEVVDYGSNGDDQVRPFMLYFDNPSAHCRSYDEWQKGACGTDFRVVIQQKNLRQFPDIYSYLGKKIRVTGVIDYYKSAYVIMVNDSRQITVID